MWYNDYHNDLFKNTTYKQPSASEQNETKALLMEMEESTHKEKGRYDPQLDLFGPNNFVPFHCYSADTKEKYESPLIGYIDNGSEITASILTQLDAVFNDQQKVQDVTYDLDEFLKEFEDLLNPSNLLNFAGSSNNNNDDDDEEEDEENEDAEEEGDEEEVDLREQLQKEFFDFSQGINIEIISFLGDAVHKDEAADFDFYDLLDRIGFFRFQAFESKEAIDEYVSQKGYGWDADKPGLCFAFGITENDSKNKYELELFFNDQWPVMQAGIPMQQLDTAPLTNIADVNHYFKYQYNGFSYLQHFVANAILQTKTNQDAIIVDMIMAQEMKPYEYSQQSEIVSRLTQIYYVLCIIPVIVVISNHLLLDKETGLKERIRLAGGDLVTYWAAWWLFAVSLSVILGIVLGFGFWIVVFYDAQLLLIIVFFFLVTLSAFAVVFAAQAPCFTRH